MNARRFVTWGRALIAVVAICAAAPSAKADLTLSFTDVSATNGTTNLAPISVNNGSTGTITVGDFTVNYTVTVSPAYPSFNGVLFESVAITATNNSGGASQLKSDLFGTGYTTPAGLVGTPTTLSAFATTNTALAAGSFINSIASYFPAGGGAFTTPTATVSGSTLSATTSVTIPSQASSFTLESYGAEYFSTGPSTSSYTTGAFIAPEPSGIAAAMAGLPCVGALIGFVRRRRIAEAATVA